MALNLWFNGFTVVPAIFVSSYLGYKLCTLRGWGVNRFMVLYALVPLYFILPESTIDVSDYLSTGEEKVGYFLAWCVLGFSIGALFSLNKRIPKKYYLAIVAKEKSEKYFKSYEANDVIYISYYDTENEQKKALNNLEWSGKFREYSSDHTGFTEHSFTKEELKSTCLDFSYVDEDRAITSHVQNKDVIEFIDAIGLNEQQKNAAWEFFQNPVKWERTKKKLLAKRNRA